MRKRIIIVKKKKVGIKRAELHYIRQGKFV